MLFTQIIHKKQTQKIKKMFLILQFNILKSTIVQYNNWHYRGWHQVNRQEKLLTGGGSGGGRW